MPDRTLTITSHLVCFEYTDRTYQGKKNIKKGIKAISRTFSDPDTLRINHASD